MSVNDVVYRKSRQRQKIYDLIKDMQNQSDCYMDL